MPIHFAALTADEESSLSRIMDRWAALYREVHGAPDPQTPLAFRMDITAVHAAIPLDLAALADAPDVDFAHDVSGIRRHIDRATGKLGGCFLPRCARGQG